MPERRLATRKPIAPDDALEQIDAAGKVTGLAQIAALDYAGELASAKAVRVRREMLRLARRYGRDSDAVKQAEARLDQHAQWSRALRREQARAAIVPPAVEPEVGIFYGRVVAFDGKPAAGATLDATDASNGVVGRTVIEKDGTYVLKAKAGEKASMTLRLQPSADRNPTALGTFVISGGTRIYREFVLPDPKDGPAVPDPRPPDPPPPTQVEMPDVVGETQSRAVATLKRLGLDNVRISAATTGTPGTVVAQKPKAGTRIPPATAIELSVAPATDANVTVPNLKGMSLAEAVTALNRVNLVPGTVDGDRQRGKVAEQKPAANAKVPPGTAVDLNLG
jgi:hypothetical protein